MLFVADKAEYLDTKKANLLFPLDNTSALLDYSENTVVYPSEDTAIQLDAVSGTDYFVMVYSLKTLDIEKVMSNFEKQLQTKTDIYQAARASLTEGTLVDASRVRFEKGDVRFSATVTDVADDLVMPVVIKIQHD